MSDAMRIEGLADMQEAVYPEGGAYHEFVVSGSEIVEGENKDGDGYVAWKLTLKKSGPGSDAYSPVSNSIFFPSNRDDAEQAARNKRDLKRAAVALGVDLAELGGGKPHGAVAAAIGKIVNIKLDMVERKKGAHAGESFPTLRWPKFE